MLKSFTCMVNANVIFMCLSRFYLFIFLVHYFFNSLANSGDLCQVGASTCTDMIIVGNSYYFTLLMKIVYRFINQVMT